jgi:hypothetical protein
MVRIRATRLGSLCACLAVIREGGEQGMRGGSLDLLLTSYRAGWLFECAHRIVGAARLWGRSLSSLRAER